MLHQKRKPSSLIGLDLGSPGKNESTKPQVKATPIMPTQNPLEARRCTLTIYSKPEDLPQYMAAATTSLCWKFSHRVVTWGYESDFITYCNLSV
jgi:hypothetical protein